MRHLWWKIHVWEKLNRLQVSHEQFSSSVLYLTSITPTPDWAQSSEQWKKLDAWGTVWNQNNSGCKPVQSALLFTPAFEVKGYWPVILTIVFIVAFWFQHFIVISIFILIISPHSIFKVSDVISRIRQVSKSVLKGDAKPKQEADEAFYNSQKFEVLYCGKVV